MQQIITLDKTFSEGESICHSAIFRAITTRDHQHFTVSEVAANCHELVIPEHIMRSSSASGNEHEVTDSAATDVPPLQLAKRLLHRVARKLLHFPSR